MGQAGTDAHVISVPPGQMEKHYSSAHDYLNATYGNQDTAWVAKNAPFGTNHTQLQRVRIVGGQRLLVKEDPNWTEKARNAVNTLHPCSPIARTWSKQLNNERRPPSPPTIPENINNLDYTDYLQQRSRDCQSHGDASALKEQISYRKKKYICQRTQPQEPDTTSDILNPHPVLPPIDDTVSIDSAEYLARYIPPGCDLASQPIALSKQDELLLKQRIARGLGCDFNRNRLKEVYNELVEYDEGLTGYVEYTNIGYALQRSQVHLAGTDLRLLCSMYVCRLEPRKVNYEKVLTFIAACYSSAGPGDGRDWQDSGASLTSGKVISEDASSRGSGSQKRDSDDLSLVKLMFENADVHKRGTLTREQIRVLSFAAGFNVKEHEIDQIMSKYERGSFPGAYNWQPYLADVTGRCGWNSKATLISPRNTSMKSLKSDQRSTRSDKQDTSSEMSRDRKHGSKSTESTPWFDRFMKMAKAFYLVDAENTGQLPVTNAKWLVQEYNSIYNLAIPSDKIALAVDESTHSEHGKRYVGIDNLLRNLVRHSPSL